MAYSLFITPTTFIASDGKLTSARRYIRRTYGAPDLRFVLGQNMDVRNGSLRYVTPTGANFDDSGYNGSFSGVASVGIKLK